MGMQFKSPTEFWLTHAAFTAVVAGITFLIRIAIARRGTQRARFIGWFVWGAVVMSYFGGGVCEYVWVNPPPSIYWNGVAMFGIIVGVVLGNVCGAVAWSYVPQQAEKSEKT